METDWGSIIIQVVIAVVGIVVSLITVVGGYWIKKVTHDMKIKAIRDEVNRYVQWAEQAPSFKLMGPDDQRLAVLDSVKAFVRENGYEISDTDLIFMIEKSIQSLTNLNINGYRRVQLKKLASQEDKNV